MLHPKRDSQYGETISIQGERGLLQLLVVSEIRAAVRSKAPPWCSGRLKASPSITGFASRGTGALAGGRGSTSRSSGTAAAPPGSNVSSETKAGGPVVGGGSSGGTGFVSEGAQVVAFCSGWASKMASFGNSPLRALSLSNSSTARGPEGAPWRSAWA